MSAKKPHKLNSQKDIMLAHKRAQWYHGCLVYLWQWMNFLEKSYEVQRLEKDHQQMIVRLEMLRVEADYLSRPQRLETVAINQMQMRLPNPAQLYQSETLFSDEVSHP